MRAGVRGEPSVVALAAMVLVWFVVFAELVWGRHHFATFDFDLGHHDQAIWLLAHGRGFDTVSGMPVLGHHFTVAHFLLAQFYWPAVGLLNPSVQWITWQTWHVETVAIPFLLARTCWRCADRGAGTGPFSWWRSCGRRTWPWPPW